MKVTIGEDLQLVCQICGRDEFRERAAQLDTAAMSFAGLDWLNASARCFVCERCGYVHWFLPQR